MIEGIGQYVQKEGEPYERLVGRGLAVIHPTGAAE